MKSFKARRLIYVSSITLSIGILSLIPTPSIPAEKIAPEICNKLLTATPQGSEAVTLFLVSPLGDSIKRTIDIGSTLRDDLRVFHTALIIGLGGGEVSFKASGNEDDKILFASLGSSTGIDEEGNVVSTSLFGYAESDGEYTLKFSTESIATAIIVTVPVYPVGHWSAPITLKLTVSME